MHDNTKYNSSQNDINNKKQHILIQIQQTYDKTQHNKSKQRITEQHKTIKYIKK